MANELKRPDVCFDFNKDDEAIQRLLDLQERTIGMEDTFEFGCKQCGECCRKRSDPVIITGYDLYNIAKAMNMLPAEAMVEFTGCTVGADSKMPVVYLKERLDGSCRLLRKGKCMIQQDKPVVCRVYPLGRYIDGKDIHYFIQDTCKGEHKTIKVRDWLEGFNIPELDEVSLYWSKLVASAVLYMQTLKTKDKQDEFFKECLNVLYFSYDMSRPAIDSLREGAKYFAEKYKGFKAPK